MSEKNKIKKRGKAKDKRSAKKTLGTLQKYNKNEIWECVLYLRGKRIELTELADRASLAKSVSWGFLEIRPPHIEATMLPLQYQSWGERSKILRKNITGARQRLLRAVRARQASNRKGPRPLSKTDRRIQHYDN